MSSQSSSKSSLGVLADKQPAESIMIRLPEPPRKSIMTRLRYCYPGIVDRYVCRQFLVSFGIVYFLIFMLYSVADFFNNFDDFMSNCDQMKISLINATSQFYYPQLFLLYDTLLTFFIVITATVSIGMIQRRMEMVALTSMGISRLRVSAVILIMSLVFIALGVANREYLIPKYRLAYTSKVNAFLSKQPEKAEPKHDPKTGVIIRGDELHTEEKTIIKPMFSMPQDSLDQYGSELRASRAVWQPAVTDSDPAKCRLQGFLLDNVEADKLPENPKTLYFGDTPVLLMPADNPWLKKGQCFLVSFLSVESLAAKKSTIAYSSFSQLRVSHDNTINPMRMEIASMIHQRLAKPILEYLTIAIGISIIIMSESNMFVTLFRVLSWLVLVFAAGIVCQTMGADGFLTPACAAWVLPGICVIIIAFIWDKIFC